MRHDYEIDKQKNIGKGQCKETNGTPEDELVSAFKVAAEKQDGADGTGQGAQNVNGLAHCFFFPKRNAFAISEGPRLR